MEYKGDFAKVVFDEEANTFHGEIIKLRDVMTFEGETVDELKKE
jgi:predicted HicB family RNase H-like nuclease